MPQAKTIHKMALYLYKLAQYYKSTFCIFILYFTLLGKLETAYVLIQISGSQPG